MIALDTNVLVRFLTRDHPEHAEAARSLLQGLTSEQPGYICREVAIEVAWVLERSYRFTRGDIAEALLELIASDNLVFEAADDIARAAYLYSQGGPGFSDRMVLAAATRTNATPLFTFDRQFARLEGVELVAADGGV